MILFARDKFRNEGSFITTDVLFTDENALAICGAVGDYATEVEAARKARSIEGYGILPFAWSRCFFIEYGMTK